MANQESSSNSMRKSDLSLSNGANLDFKIANDVTGTPVVSQLLISFDTAAIPAGGIGANLLREIKISELLALWFQESSRSFLPKSQENQLWKILASPWENNRRNGIDERNYAALAYFYIQYCENFPNSPTANLASDLGVSVKTLATRLGQSRKLGFLSSESSGTRTGKAHGRLTKAAKELVIEMVGRK